MIAVGEDIAGLLNFVMRGVTIVLCCCAAVVMGGCAKMPSSVTPVAAGMSAPEESPSEPQSSSLFPADQAVLSDEAVARALSTRVRLADKARVALLRFPDNEGSRHFGRYYWRDEQYLKLQQSQVDTLSRGLLEAGQVGSVTPLPSLMVPARISLPVLREAAVRMQADLLVVYRVRSDTFSQYRTFSKDKVKAYSTCEVVLLDIRTGLVPFTRVVSRDALEVKASEDLDLRETMRRAQLKAAEETLRAAVDELADFLRAASKERQ